jgi:hypothetical protein
VDSADYYHSVEAEFIQTAVTKGLKVVTAYMMPKWLS